MIFNIARFDHELKTKLMKKLLFAAGIAIVTFSIACSQSQVDQSVIGNNDPAIKFETNIHDYGIVVQGGNGIYDFVFTNTGNAPLILNNVRSSCGCTIPEWPKEPIAPGETGLIKVKYNTNRIGTINKSVTVYSNAPGGPVVLRIKGTVVTKDAAAKQ